MLKGLYKSIEFNGVVAQLGERLNGIQEVRSSILLSSTKIIKDLSNKLKSFFLFVLVSLLHNIFVCCHHCKKTDTDMRQGVEKNKPRSDFINLLSSS